MVDLLGADKGVRSFTATRGGPCRLGEHPPAMLTGSTETRPH